MAVRVLLVEIDNGKGLELFFSSAGYVTRSTDTPANQVYDARVNNDPEYARAVGIYVQGGGASPRALGDIDLINTDGALDYLLGEDVRDSAVTLRIVELGAAYSTSVVVGGAVAERLDVTGERSLRLILRDKGALLDRPVANSFYSASTPNTELEGELKPLALGRLEYVPLVPYDVANLVYDLSDGAFAQIEECRDQGVLITYGVGWDYDVTATVAGMRRLAGSNPAGRQCVKMLGGIDLTGSDVLAGIGSFTTWSLDNPSGWITSEGIARQVTQSVQKCRFNRSVAGDCKIAKASVLTIGERYFWSIDVAAVTSGSVELRDSSGAVIRNMSVVGSHSGTFVAAGTGIELGAYVTTADVVVDNLVIYPCTFIERLTDWIEHICEVRGPLDASEIDYAGTIADLDTAAPWTLAWYGAQETPIRDLLRQTLDSFCGAYWFDRLGVLRVGRIIAPSGSPVVEFSDIDIVGDITIDVDTAPALSDRMAGRPNYAVHQSGEIAGSIQNTAVETRLRRDRVKRKGASALHSTYSHAVGHTPVPTLLSQGTHVKSAADYLTSYYASQRWVAKFRAKLPNLGALQLEPFDVIKVTSDRFGFGAGQLMWVRTARGGLLRDSVDIEACY